MRRRIEETLMVQGGGRSIMKEDIGALVGKRLMLLVAHVVAAGGGICSGGICCWLLRDGDVNVGKKRSAAEETSVDASTKRIRPTPTVSKNELKDNNPSVGLTTSRGADVNIGPVQQLVAMFGALIAQGEKAVGSLEILISSISTDLLAEVVMVNMHHLPPNRPESEGDEQLLLNSTSASNTQVKHSSFSLSNAFPQIASLLDAQSSDLIDTIKTERKVVK